MPNKFSCANHSSCLIGVKAALVRKDNKPKWDPASVEDVTEENISLFFKPLEEGDRLPI